MTPDLISAILRILVRYGSAALVTWGAIAPETQRELLLDPDVLMLIGLSGAVLAELLFGRAVMKAKNHDTF